MMNNEKKSISEVLDSLIETASSKKKFTFREMAVTAGLNPSKDFRGATLRELDFRDENLNGFDFSNADLTGSDFRGAKLKKAIFTGANLRGTVGIVYEDSFTDIVPLDIISATREVKKNIIENIKPDIFVAEQVIELRFGKTKIADVSKLKHVKNLQSLSLIGTKVTNINALSHLMNLQDLTIDNTKVKNLSPLTNCKSLKTFSAKNTPINSIYDIRNCRSLVSLSLDKTFVKTIREILYLRSLERFSVGSYNLKDLSPISECSELKSICLETPKATEMPDFSYLRELHDLRISTSCYDFPLITEDNKLEYLSVASEKCAFIPNLLHLKNLKGLFLDLKNFDITSELRISNNVSLLMLSNMDLTDIPVQKYLTNIEDLYLSGNKIKSFDFINNMINLKKLRLGYSRELYNLNTLPVLPNLESVTLTGYAYNYIGLSNLSNMPKLQTVHTVDGNIVEEILNHNKNVKIFRRGLGPITSDNVDEY